MAQQFGQNGYLGMVAKAASSFAEGEGRSRSKKKDDDLVSRIEGQAVKAIGAKLLSGDGMGPTSNSRNVGHLVNRVSTFHQDRFGGGKNGGSSYAPRGMSDDGYSGYGGNSRGGYGGYGGGGGWGGGSEGRGGYGGDAGWSSGGVGGSSGWDRPGGSVGLGRQGGYYGDGGYDGYGGNRGRVNDGYADWNDKPPMARDGYGYA